MNFDGPVRVASTAGSGTATVTLSFDAWNGARVAPTTHDLTVLPPKAWPKPEPASANLIGSLVHPDRKANVVNVRFSPDGKRLFTAGYPSGVVQVWDWAAKKELVRIDTPPGRRPTYHYTALTADWKTLYAPIEARKVTSIEKDGKVAPRVEYTGRVAVWDLTTGKEQPALKLPAGSAPFYATLSPDGRHLVTAERQSYTAGERQEGGIWAWDLRTEARRKLAADATYPRISPDGATIAFTEGDFEKKVYVLKLVEVATGKEVASFRCPEKDAIMTGGDFSPDGSLVAVDVRSSRDRGGRGMILFLDAKTLAERGRFVGDPNPDGYGIVFPTFSPDGKACVLLDLSGKAHVWDVAAGKVVRSFESGWNGGGWQSAFSPDGKTLALPWVPATADGERVRDPDPRDLPQPRVSLIDLTGKAPPRVLVAPHGGMAGSVAFSPDGKTLAFGSSGAVHLFDLTK